MELLFTEGASVTVEPPDYFFEDQSRSFIPFNYSKMKTSRPIVFAFAAMLLILLLAIYLCLQTDEHYPEEDGHYPTRHDPDAGHLPDDSWIAVNISIPVPPVAEDADGSGSYTWRFYGSAASSDESASGDGAIAETTFVDFNRNADDSDIVGDDVDPTEVNVSSVLALDYTDINISLEQDNGGDNISDASGTGFIFVDFNIKTDVVDINGEIDIQEVEESAIAVENIEEFDEVYDSFTINEFLKPALPPNDFSAATVHASANSE